MQDMGFSCRIPCVKPLLNNRQRQKRLAWAKDKKDWTAAEWSKVMFTDESKFCISFGNQGPIVWRKRGEAQNPCRLRFSVKFPQSVMVWGAMSCAGVGPLCFLRSKVNTAVYQLVLEHFMLPACCWWLWWFWLTFNKNQPIYYLNKLEYGDMPHNHGEYCWSDSCPEDNHWHPSQGG